MSDREHQEADQASVDAMRQRVARLAKDIDADRERARIFVATEQAKLDRWNRRFARVPGFSRSHRSLRIPAWVAILVIACFVGGLVWAAL
jgi:hypothetical protein